MLTAKRVQMMDISTWKSQLRKGAAEFAVLALLERSDAYGLQILESVGEQSGIGVSEGSLYPLLNKMQKQGSVTARWIEDEEATHPRKYYSLTGEGRGQLAAMRTAWVEFRNGIDSILEKKS
jgi:PadR family transcriptional regulator PadR